MHIADVSFPEVKEKATTACEQATLARRALYVEILRKARLEFKNDVWKKLK